MELTSIHGQVDRVTVLLHGIPLGEAWLAEGDLVFATLEPARGYDGFATDIREASQALWALGFLEPRRARIAVEALAPDRDHAFELRDSAGRGVATDFVNVVEPPRPNEPPVVVVYRKYVNAAVAAVMHPPSGTDRSANA